MKRAVFCLILSAFVSSVAAGQQLTAEQAAEKLRLATPVALPQEPSVKKGRPDTLDAGLKGKVTTVLSQKGEPGKPAMTFGAIEEFDKDGALLRQVFYDEYGNPGSVTVYGYIDGKRVARTGYIDYDYSPPAPPGPKRPADAPNFDPRYMYAYEADYDAKGELIEKRTFLSNGEQTSRTVYVRNGAKRERTPYGRDGKPQPWGLIETFDASGNVVETVRPSTSAYGPVTMQYKYETFDATGNWTRRIATRKVQPRGESERATQEIELRVITYYQ